MCGCMTSWRVVVAARTRSLCSGGGAQAALLPHCATYCVMRRALHILRLECLTPPAATFSSSSRTHGQPTFHPANESVLHGNRKATNSGSPSVFALRRGEEGVFEHGVGADAKGYIAEVEEEQQQQQQHWSDSSCLSAREEKAGSGPASLNETYVPSGKERYALRNSVGHLAAEEVCLPRHALNATAELNLKKSRQLDELLSCSMPALAKAEEVCAMLPDFYTGQLALPPRSAELVMALLSQTSLQLRVRRIAPSSPSSSSLLLRHHHNRHARSLDMSSLPPTSHRHRCALTQMGSGTGVPAADVTDETAQAMTGTRLDQTRGRAYDASDERDVTRLHPGMSKQAASATVLHTTRHESSKPSYQARTNSLRRDSHRGRDRYSSNKNDNKDASDGIDSAATPATGHSTPRSDQSSVLDLSHMEGVPFLTAMRTLYAHQKVCFVAPTPLTLEHLMLTLASVTAKSTAVFQLAQRLLIDADKYVTLPTRTLYTAYFNICATNDAMSFAVARMRDAVLQLGISLDANMTTALLQGLNERGYVEEAVALLARVQHVPLTTPLLNAALESLLLSGQPMSCFSTLRAVHSASVRLNADTYTLLLLACEEMGEWEHVTQILADMQRRRVKGNAQTLNLLLKGLLKQKLHSYAAQLHGTMRVKRVPVWPELDDHVTRWKGGGGHDKSATTRPGKQSSSGGTSYGANAMLPHGRRVDRRSRTGQHA